MSIKDDLNTLTKQDTYSLLLFALYKLKEDPKYSTLSQLAYVLSYDDMIKLSKVLGGLTITIPDIKDIQALLDGLSIYDKIDLNNFNSEETLSQYNKTSVDMYLLIRNLLKEYIISGRGDMNA